MRTEHEGVTICTTLLKGAPRVDEGRYTGTLRGDCSVHNIADPPITSAQEVTARAPNRARTKDAPTVKRTDSQERPSQGREAEALYRFELMLREMGLSDFVYDGGEDLFRFRDGRFAFSRHHADTKLLLERNHLA